MTIAAALAWFGLICLATVATSIMHTYFARGFGYGFSSNRVVGEESAFEIRLRRTIQNNTEACAYIVPVLLAAQFSGLSGADVGIAALLIVIGRAAYVPLYLSGIPFIRVPAFVMASFPTFYLLFRLAGII